MLKDFTKFLIEEENCKEENICISENGVFIIEEENYKEKSFCNTENDFFIIEEEFLL